MTFSQATTSELFKFGAQLKKELAAQSTSNVVSIFKNFYSSIVVAVDGSNANAQFYRKDCFRL